MSYYIIGIIYILKETKKVYHCLKLHEIDFCMELVLNISTAEETI